ncbi:MAG: immune inhibitor A domain-containing protein [Bacilli bacterium]|jgi:M6 family metalloprotease-like protein
MKKKTLITTLLISGLLTSCQFSRVEFFPYIPLTSTQIALEVVTNSATYRPAEYAIDFNEVYRANPSNRQINCRALGEQNLLVIPISLPNRPANLLDKNNGEDALTIIKNAFFGQEKLTQWESVASFYNKSSYGQLQITGKVLDWYTPNNDDQVLDNIADYDRGLVTVSNTKITEKLLRQSVDYFKGQFPDLVEDFDRDQDGFIDAVFMVYSSPISRGVKEHEFSGTNELYWAYSSHDLRSPKPSPKANAYAWASYDFLNLGNTWLQNKPDAHTYIHEVGHLFGLNDYYNTNSASNNPLYGPTGGMDMMDFSLGDHTGLSKMLLNWVKPLYVHAPTTVSLKPFNTSGELILLAPTWNDSPFDEFILLEYYAPTKLNYYDAHLQGNYRLLNRYGLKVYHVNSTLTDRTTMVGDQLVTFPIIAHDNSPTYNDALNDVPVFYKLLDKRGIAPLKSGELANAQSLFILGDDFGTEFYADFRFDDKSALDLGFKIIKQTKSELIISFYHLQ